MIENDQYYRKAERKLIARTHEELAIYESQSEAMISRASVTVHDPNCLFFSKLI